MRDDRGFGGGRGWWWWQEEGGRDGAEVFDEGGGEVGFGGKGCMKRED